MYCVRKPVVHNRPVKLKNTDIWNWLQAIGSNRTVSEVEGQRNRIGTDSIGLQAICNLNDS